MNKDDRLSAQKNEKPQRSNLGVSSRSKFRTKLNLFNKTWVATAALIGVLLLSGASYYIYNNRDNELQFKEPITLDSQYPGNPDSEQTYKQKSEVMYYRGSYDEAQTVLDEGIKGADGDVDIQAEFYVKKAEFAINDGKYEEALGFAEKADELSGTVGSAALAGLSAELSEDNFKAIKYYSLAADRTSENLKNPESSGSDYGIYLSKIKALGGTYED